LNLVNETRDNMHIVATRQTRNSPSASEDFAPENSVKRNKTISEQEER
jgi:hypothetical protein